MGVAEGLGPAAVKYLSAHGQHIITPDTADLNERVNYIINNTNYRLFHDTLPDIDAAANATISLLTSFGPFLSQDPPGMIINIPPQLCLATLEDPSAGAELLRQMDLFLELLKERLMALGYPLRFIEPGERLFEPSYI